MKEQILQLCRRINCFTLDKLETITELNRSELLEILNQLESEKMISESNGQYYYVKKEVIHNQKLPKFFNYHSPETNDLILKCFCADISVLKVAQITEPSKSAISNYYAFFRKVLYSLQYSELKKNFDNDPKIPSIRALYDIKIYLYNYNNKIYISSSPLKCNKKAKKQTKEELRISNKAYYKIRRDFQNFAYTQCFAEIAYLKYWLDGKTQEEKYNFLNDMLNISS